MAEELYKQPPESRLYHFEFANLLASGETISSASPITQVNLGKIPASSDLTLGAASISGSIVQVRISAGTEDESYRLKSIIVTSDTNTLELDGILHITDL